MPPSVALVFLFSSDRLTVVLRLSFGLTDCLEITYCVGRLSAAISLGVQFNSVSPMRFKLPFNDDITVRVFERVETTDAQYDIVDCGLEYDDGSIDSLAVGGSFSSLKKWTAPKDSNADTPTDED